jgi:hypothetical protein
MNDFESGIHGLMWDVNAISTAEWTGIKLKDLLAFCGVDFSDEKIKHIQFEGLDKDPGNFAQNFKQNITIFYTILLYNEN